MLVYWLSGKGYTKILVNAYMRWGNVYTDQFYSYNDVVVKRSSACFRLDKNNPQILEGIETDDEDTIILPKGYFTVLPPKVLSGCKFRRFIIPKGASFELQERALFGNDNLTDFMSLSRNVVYSDNVFPRSVERRCF